MTTLEQHNMSNLRMMREQEKRKLTQDAFRFCNDRARLQHALEITLERLGFCNTQINNIVNDVKKASFASLKKAMKITS